MSNLRVDLVFIVQNNFITKIQIKFPLFNKFNQS